MNLMDCTNEALNGKLPSIKRDCCMPTNNKTSEHVKLTVREKEILKLIASGLTTPNITEQLF
jgi:DNA-binding NarL/FixJ family response regulator